MELYDEQEMAIEDFFKLSQEEGEFEIDTPDGWQKIGSLVNKGNKECYCLTLSDGRVLKCSSDHCVNTKNGWQSLEQLSVNEDLVETDNGFVEIVTKEFLSEKYNTYDLEVLSESHKYYSNGIVSHNTGKSLCAKVVADLYQMPLLRLDFGKLFGSYVGESEEASRNAIKLAEAIAPCVLWCDEIEKGLAGAKSSGQTDGGTTSRVVSTFLTWMQEKTAPVFMFCTANDHEAIPPEFMRAGRFDETFFVDLPNPKERREIFEVLLRRYNRKPKDFNLGKLSSVTENYSGAEIEKCIITAMFEAFGDNAREIKTEDLVTAAGTFKPLYAMRKEDFDEMRDWATDRCVPANGDDTKVGKSGEIGIDI
jgi:hypothetical protein